ncbi:hypothetical protein ASE48_08370 [Mycobacterium sp. Root265]|uniref:DUF5403 family protein n=1 Tax=Mycobacterium sp. Root265 TaxID=1736504 RepID=UPI00070A9DA2|nr:DUF5403 family protein [Mycobacterium sp. Root265]KRD08571.1 hypothetical protein ASE48_08370 [Mycobacterium sp. Root265]
MAWVSPKINGIVARHKDTQKAVRRVNRDVAGRARANLAAQNTTRRISKIGHFEADIATFEHDVDCFTILIAPNAMALEFGHSPSGFFAGTDTKPPAPTYILTKAAYGGHTM